MAVRVATFDPNAADGGPDVARIMRLLSGVPNPPNMEPADFERLITSPNEKHLVDTTNDTAIRLVVEGTDVVIPWWLGPDEIAAANARQWAPVLLAAVEAVLAQWPASGPWPLYGDLQGGGATVAAQASKSLAIATVVHGFLGIAAAPERSPINGNMYRAQSTVAQVRDALVAMGL